MKHTESEFLVEVFTAPQGEPGPHLTNDQLDACATGTIAETERQAVERHLDHCAECAEIVLRLLEADATQNEALPFPTTIFLPWDPEAEDPQVTYQWAAHGTESPKVAKFDVPGLSCYIKVSAERGHAWLTVFGADRNHSAALERWRVLVRGECVAEFSGSRTNCAEARLFGRFQLSAPDGTTIAPVLRPKADDK